MRAGVWRRLVERTGVGVLEFYASTEGALVLANAAGDKVGALGRPAARIERGRRARVGLLPPAEIARDLHAGPGPAGWTAWTSPASSPPAPASPRRRSPKSRPGQRDVFEPGDAWLTTGDLARRDADGDYWFVDRLVDVMRTAAGPLPSRPLEDTLYALPEVALAVVLRRPRRADESRSPSPPSSSAPEAALDGAARSSPRFSRPPTPRRRSHGAVRVLTSLPHAQPRGFARSRGRLRAPKGLRRGEGAPLWLDASNGSWLARSAPLQSGALTGTSSFRAFAGRWGSTRPGQVCLAFPRPPVRQACWRPSGAVRFPEGDGI